MISSIIFNKFMHKNYKKITIHLFIVNLFFVGCKSTDQKSSMQQFSSENNMESKISSKKNFKFLFYIGDYDQKFGNFANQNRLLEVRYLDENMMIDAATFTVDHRKLALNLAKYYPNINDTGYCYLNVEAPYSDLLLYNTEENADFKKGYALFMDIITTLKKLRPNVKFGFYAFPFTTYWETQTGFYKKNDKIENILKAVDVYFPSFYMFYDDGVVGYIKNNEYLRTNTTEMVKLAKKYNKELYPFVMHRYHPSNKKIAWKMMEDDEWRNYISIIVNTISSGKQVDGIVWWGPDSYYFQQGNVDAFKKEFKGTQKQFEVFNDDKLINKARIIIEEFRNAK